MAKPIDIPISAAENIAKKYGYDQVIIYARKPGDEDEAEHMTTYGTNSVHCKIAASMGNTLKIFMGWDVEK